MVAKTDYCGMVSGGKKDKGSLFSDFYGVLGTAPMIEECQVNLECRVADTLRYGSYEVWIAETCLEEGITPAEPKKWPSLDEMNPIVYTPAGTYCDTGKQIGKGYDAGKTLKKRGAEAIY